MLKSSCHISSCFAAASHRAVSVVSRRAESCSFCMFGSSASHWIKLQVHGWHGGVSPHLCLAQHRPLHSGEKPLEGRKYSNVFNYSLFPPPAFLTYYLK